MHRPDLVEQFGRERQLQLLNDAHNQRSVHMLRLAHQVQPPVQKPSFVTRLFAMLRRQPAASM